MYRLFPRIPCSRLTSGTNKLRLPSQSVIGEIKLASALAADLMYRLSLRITCSRLTSRTNKPLVAQSKCNR